MQVIDLNADLGESFGDWKMGADAQMLDIVNSANIACGGHAGDETVMFETIKMAAKRGVAIGAHPGFNDKQGFGRRRIALSMPEIERLIAAQVGTIKGIAALAEARVSYVKPHGALNNWATESADVSQAIARAIKASCPELAMLAVSGTELEKASRAAGLDTYCEIFADRGYNADGTLVARGQDGAMITDAGQAADRLVQFFETGDMPTVDGGSVRLNAQSICIHGDSQHAVEMAIHIRDTLRGNGFTLQSFTQPQMDHFPQIKPIADTGVLIEFGASIDEAIHAQVLAMDQAVQTADITGVTEMIPAYAALYVGYDALVISYDDLADKLTAMLGQKQGSATPAKHWRIPVCYDPEFALDMDELADQLDLTADGVIAAHTSATYKVYMYGFAPGYAYLGGVPAPLQLPRKSAPVMGIPPQSVMVAGEQSLITTVTMPSGWWVIGKSGVNPLDANSNTPFLFNVGDTVGFEPVSKTDLAKHGQG